MKKHFSYQYKVLLFFVTILLFSSRPAYCWSNQSQHKTVVLCGTLAETAPLEISKTVSNADGSPLTTPQINKPFSFEITFSESIKYNYEIQGPSGNTIIPEPTLSPIPTFFLPPENSNASLTPKLPIDKSIQDKSLSPKPTSIPTTPQQPANQITITLKHGEKIVFKDLPIGTSYTITETKSPNYTPNKQTFQGQISAFLNKVDFKNTFNPLNSYPTPTSTPTTPTTPSSRPPQTTTAPPPPTSPSPSGPDNPASPSPSAPAITPEPEPPHPPPPGAPPKTGVNSDLTPYFLILLLDAPILAALYSKKLKKH